MTDRPPCYVAAAAVVTGWPAYALARVLRRHLPELLESLDPSLRRPLAETLEALTLAGAAYARSRGTAEPAAAEQSVSSKTMDETMTTDQAARELDCSSRWVRRLLADGTLPGHLERRRWLVDAAAVHAYRETGGR